MTENPSDRTPDDQTPADQPADQDPTRPARVGWRERASAGLAGTRGLVAVGVAGLLLGGFGGAGVAALAASDDDGGRDGRGGRDGGPGRHGGQVPGGTQDGTQGETADPV